MVLRVVRRSTVCEPKCDVDAPFQTPACRRVDSRMQLCVMQQEAAMEDPIF